MTPKSPDIERQQRRSGEQTRAHERDIEELRKDLAAAAEESEGVPKAQLKELILLEAGTDPEDLERPYLETIPGQYAARLTLFEWLQFVLDRGGLQQTLDVIEYYVDIGWISSEAAESLEDHVRVFQEAAGDGEGSLETADHLVSLVYVARLASMT
jgi:flagellar protein FlaE